MAAEVGIFIKGILVGYETKEKREGGTTTAALIACGMESYRVSFKAEEVKALYETPCFEGVSVRARPFVSNGKLYWTDGAMCSAGD